MMNDGGDEDQSSVELLVILIRMPTMMLAAELAETLVYCLDGIDVRSDDNIGG